MSENKQSSTTEFLYPPYTLNHELNKIIHTLSNMIEHNETSIEQVTNEINKEIAFNLGITNSTKLGQLFTIENFKLVPPNYTFAQWLSYYRGILATNGQSIPNIYDPTFLMLFAKDVGSIEAVDYMQKYASHNLFTKIKLITQKLNSIVPLQFLEEYNKYRKLQYNRRYLLNL